MILNGEMLKVCLPLSETKQRCPLTLLLFNILVEVSNSVSRQENEIKIGKEEIKLFFADGIILYLRKFKIIYG